MIRNLKKLVKKLEASDPSVRRKAAEEMAEGDERVIYPLIKALSDPNSGVQDAAMRTLISLGGEITAYMVLPLLRENSYLRNTALIILRELGELAVPLLYPLLKDKDADIRKFAIDLLGEIKKGVDPSKIVAYLADANANVRAAAAKALGELRYRLAIPEMINALRDEEWVCFSVLEALGDLCAEEAVEKIALLLENPSDALRFAAIETLGKFSSESASAALRTYLPKTSGDERNAVIKSLIQIGITPEMADLSGYLVSMLKKGDWEEKEVVLKGVSALNCKEAVPVMVDVAGSLDPSLPGNEEKILLLKRTISSVDSEEELLKLLDSTDMRYRGKSFAIEILGESGSKRAIPRLIGYLADMRRDLRRASTQALGALGAAETIEPLLEASHRDVDAHVRRSAIDALGRIGSKEAYKPLLDLLEVEKLNDVMERIVQAIVMIDAEIFLSRISEYNDSIREAAARSITDVDVLVKLAEDRNKRIKIAALYGLGRSGSEKAVSALTLFLKDPDADIRKTAVVGLGEARHCSPELLEALKDVDPWVRFYAIKSVAFSCDRERAVEIIRAMLNDEFIPVVMAAIDAIREIGGREAYEALKASGEHANPAVREKIVEALDSL
ncbi:MAG TPA: HEAT repeat domain-containing protein [Dissulfurispiraceae bacterium]